MPNLNKWKNKFKERRKKTNFRDYLKEIVSWQPLTFYKNNGKISIFPESNRRKDLVSPQEFGDMMDEHIKAGIEYNFDKNFFDNFQKLQDKISFPALRAFGERENSDYADTIFGGKNIYLSMTAVIDVEDVFYSFSVKNWSKNVYNSNIVWDGSENIYMSSCIINGFNIFYSKYLHNCSDIWFSSNLIWCKECILCKWLENQSYCIENKQYNKEEFYKKKVEILAKKEKFLWWYENLEISGQNIGSNHTNGSFVLQSNDVKNGYFAYQVNKGKNIISVWWAGKNSDIYDCFGAVDGEDFYANFGVWSASNLFSCMQTGVWGSNMYYTMYCIGCSFCLGCIWLTNKQYHIFNKEYSKEDWYKLADKIFSQMDKDGLFGEFFPGKLNPYYFNDTAAYLIDESFDKEEILEEWYLWRDEEIKVDIPERAELIKSNRNVEERNTERKNQKGINTNSNLEDFQWYDSDGNWVIDKDILKKVIEYKGNYYRIISSEYNFLMKYGLPIPEIHWIDRIKLGFRF